MKYKRYLLIAAAALLMIGAAAVSPAMAYFTDTHTASGMVTLSLGDSNVKPDESFDGMNKLITVTNTGDYAVFVRVKAIYGSNCTVTLDAASSSGWSDGGDGYYYYASPLEGKTGDASAGESSSQLKLIVAAKEDTTADSFNVIILEEATRVRYDSNGNAIADWNDVIKVETDASDESSDTENSENSADNTDADETSNTDNSKNTGDNSGSHESGDSNSSETVNNEEGHE